MRRILVVQSRPEDAVADAELEAMVRFGGLDEARIDRVRLDREIPPLDLAGVDAVLVGGGPANFSDEHRRPPGHAETVAWLTRLGAAVVRDDIPYLGACLGLGAVVHALGGRMVRGIAESVAPVELSLTGSDWLTDGLPRAFTAFGGHKEGIAEAPEGATTLAVSAACVHMVRVGEHVVGTQFHPELDADGLEQRIRVYRDHGYFSPDEVDDLIAAGRAAHVEHPQEILRRFAHRYGLQR
ncbi:gamma-glutamyl-gamma-aminobutyrate hydrolase family protein [Agrococcus sp. HG114]|uniref:glutamine amidotransferase-related protein n=1 Tax=Agrococcus sp. HG114 TaxID=2969757 RepID=UPI00215B6974|nr:gamma-glutamyl-gamma-aminobutyrate hydrolase family protein [Agrococcus sp. HG114]MCR8670899.1 gamma-glutamyl-gamma-aminobutyrate hydrolase family protein [Agrococcus sp. HG114]